MTVVIVIAILGALSIQAYAFLIERAQRVNCTTNLKSLYTAASAYTNDYKSWPQVSTTNVQDPSYAQAWMAALAPYQITAANWICPSVQRLLKNPDYMQPENIRLDYFATPFDANPVSPSKYPTQPWFVERGNMHGDGNLMIFASGQVKSLNEALQDSFTQPQVAP